MAEKPKKSKDKRSRRRRARRTEVETSSSDSDSDSNVSTKVEQTKAGAEESDVEMQDEASEAPSEPAKTIKQVSDADFESWYLQQVTKELSDDLDKIRSASDFKDSSLPVLITALKQGTSLFSQDEKQRILGGAP